MDEGALLSSAENDVTGINNCQYLLTGKSMEGKAKRSCQIAAQQTLIIAFDPAIHFHVSVPKDVS